MTVTVNLDPDELVVGASGYVFVAPEGTTMPTKIADVIPNATTGVTGLAAGWIDLGYLTEDGPQFSFNRTTKDVGAWQSFYALRTLITEVPTSVEYSLRQWNADTFDIALGGTVVSTTTGGTKIEPEDASFLDIRSLIVYGADGDRHYAFCFHRAQNKRELQFPWKRDDESALPIGMSILGPPAGVTKPWFMLTDDTAFTAHS